MPNLKWSFAAATSGSKKGRWAWETTSRTADLEDHGR